MDPDTYGSVMVEDTYRTTAPTPPPVSDEAPEEEEPKGCCYRMCNPFKTAVTEFAESTTAHGVPRVASSKAIWLQIFWGVMSLATISFCLYQIVMLVIYYFTYPVEIVREAVYDTVDFPAVSFCNLNAIRESQLNLGDSIGLQDIVQAMNEASFSQMSGQSSRRRRSTAQINGGDGFDVGRDSRVLADNILQHAPRMKRSVTTLYDYGNSNGDTALPNGDDIIRETVLDQNFPFYGNTYTDIWVSTNGLLSFDTGTLDYSAAEFPITSSPLLAAFWGNADTGSNRGEVHYRETYDPGLLVTLSASVQTVADGYGISSFLATAAFIATWEDVCFSQSSDGADRNTFQIAIMTDGTYSFAVYKYTQIEWTVSTADTYDAQAGFNAGDGVNSYSLPGSRTASVADLVTSSNMGTPGTWIFRIDEATISDPDTATTEAPTTAETAAATVLFAYGSTEGDTTLIQGDDRVASMDLNDPFPFFGNTYTRIYVATNGIATFTAGISTYTAVPFPSTIYPMFALFWADTYTTIHGAITYRAVYDNPTLQTLSESVQEVAGGYGITFQATMGFIATWDAVPEYRNTAGTNRNTYQLAIMTDGTYSFAVYKYITIEWTHTTSGSNHAQAGFDAGDGATSYTIPSSRTADVANLVSTTNVDIPGTWIFRVDLAQILSGIPTQEPVETTTQQETTTQEQTTTQEPTTEGPEPTTQGEEQTTVVPDTTTNTPAPVLVAEQDAGADPIDQVYQPIASLEDLPWFDNTNDEPAAEVENTAAISRALLDLPLATRREMGTLLTDFLQECTWNGVVCSPLNFTAFTSRKYGNCFTFNGGTVGDVRRQTSQGQLYGFSATLFIDQRNYIFSLTPAAGVRVVIHRQDHYPFMEDDGFNVSPGQRTAVTLHKYVYRRLGAPFGHCGNGRGYNLHYDTTYTIKACVKTCYQNKIVSKCACADSTLAIISNQSPCVTDSELSCQRRIYRDFEKKKYKCDCPELCNDEEYKTHVSGSTWPGDAMYDTVLNSFAARSEYMNTTLRAPGGVRKNLLKLDVYFDQLKYDKIKEKEAYGTTQLLADMGGQLGLWIGISALTMIELIQFLIQLPTYICCKKKESQDEDPEEGAEDDPEADISTREQITEDGFYGPSPTYWSNAGRPIAKNA